MHFTETLFWIAFAIIFYNYIGYGLILYALITIKKIFIRESATDNAFEPEVSLLIAAYNETDFIEQKIRNCFELEYTKDKLHIIFITDGSTDDSPQKINQHSHIQLLHKPEREGKTAALNRAMQYVTTPIVVFCDANTILNQNAIKNIVRHYADLHVGGVAGEKKIIASTDTQAAGAGEGIYWKYESLLKKLDSAFYSVVGAAGELFSIRTALFERVDPDIILDDFVISLKVAEKGYRVKYDSGAYAMETPSATMQEERKRKIRICAGGFQAILRLRSLLNFFRHPLLTFQYFSHRVLRWTLTPISLPIIFVTSILLMSSNKNPFYPIFFFGQVVFYILAIAGYYYSNRNIKIKWLYLPYYFLFMNIAVYQGFIKFIKNKQTVLWEKSQRKKST